MSATTETSSITTQLRQKVQDIFDETVQEYHGLDEPKAGTAVAGLFLRNENWKNLGAAGYLFTNKSHAGTNILGGTELKKLAKTSSDALFSRVTDYFNSVALHPQLQRFILEDIRKTPVDASIPFINNLFFELQQVPFIIATPKSEGDKSRSMFDGDMPETYIFDSSLKDAVQDGKLVCFKMRRKGHIRCLQVRRELGDTHNRLPVDITVDLEYTYRVDSENHVTVTVTVGDFTFKGNDTFSREVLQYMRFEAQHHTSKYESESVPGKEFDAQTQKMQAVFRAQSYAAGPIARLPRVYKTILGILAVISVVTSLLAGFGLLLGYATYRWYQDRVKPQWEWKKLLVEEPSPEEQSPKVVDRSLEHEDSQQRVELQLDDEESSSPEYLTPHSSSPPLTPKQGCRLSSAGDQDHPLAPSKDQPSPRPPSG